MSLLRARVFRLLAGIFAIALPTGSRATTLTLSDAVQRALENGPDAMIARLEAERAGDSLGQARGAYLPTLALTSQAGYSNRLDDKLRAVDANGVERTYGLASIGSQRGWLNLFLRQQLLDLRTWHEIARSELEAEAAEVAQREQREGIAFAVLQAYVDVLRYERLVALDTEHRASTEWLDRQAEIRLGAGRSLPSEREQVALHLQEVGVEAELRRMAVAQARRILCLLSGLDEVEASPLELEPGTLPVPVPAQAAGAPPALEDAPEVRILGLRERAEELTVSAARAGRFPTLALNAGYSHYGAKRFDNFEDEFVVGVDLALPLFDGLRTHYAVSAASKGAEIARLRYQALLERKRARVRELEERLGAAKDRPQLARKRAAVARERMRLADLSLQAERGTLDAALDTRRAYDAAAAAAIDAELDTVVAWATLQREKGLLAAAILGESPRAGR